MRVNTNYQNYQNNQKSNSQGNSKAQKPSFSAFENKTLRTITEPMLIKLREKAGDRNVTLLQSLLDPHHVFVRVSALAAAPVQEARGLWERGKRLASRIINRPPQVTIPAHVAENDFTKPLPINLSIPTPENPLGHNIGPMYMTKPVPDADANIMAAVEKASAGLDDKLAKRAAKSKPGSHRDNQASA